MKQTTVVRFRSDLVSWIHGTWIYKSNLSPQGFCHQLRDLQNPFVEGLWAQIIVQQNQLAF
jgi:hypothetical protein